MTGAHQLCFTLFFSTGSKIFGQVRVMAFDNEYAIPDTDERARDRSRQFVQVRGAD